MAKAEATVEELVSMIERGELRLPEMQRRFVWRSTRVRDLLDSLYRGYPSGAILLSIARELVATVHDNVCIKGTLRENVRVQHPVLVKRFLRKYGYAPDKQEKATQTVLEQAEVLSEGWAVA